LVQAAKEYTAAENIAFITADTKQWEDPDKYDGISFTERHESLWFKPSDEVAAEDGIGYTYDESTGTYTWEITKVEAGVEWAITEYPQVPEDAVDLSEWIWIETESGTSDTGFSQSTTVTGITQAADEKVTKWLEVNFTNMYHLSNTILIRKVDGESGNGLPGAVFNLYQVDQDGNETLMHFTYNATKQIYEWDQTGMGMYDLTVNDSGYLEYTVGDFSYDNGDIVVREKLAPSGYAGSPDVTVGKNSGGNIVILDLGADADPGKDQTYYAEYANGVLTVKNYSDPETLVDVKAVKDWDCDASYYTENGKEIAVRLILTANGKFAPEVIPGFTDKYGSYWILVDGTGAYTELDASGNPKYLSGGERHSYTWQDLPSVIDGQEITWSVVEVQVGSEVMDAGGNFPNWIVSPTRSNAYDGADGTKKLDLTVTNTPKRAMLRLTKYDMAGSTLPGAKFRLTQLDSSGNSMSNPRTGTTDSSGTLTFDNLKYETWYQLDETEAPAEYWRYVQPAYVKLSSNGYVTVTGDLADTAQSHTYVSYPGMANNISVRNFKPEALPDTGGLGDEVYVQSGMLLMLAAALWMYKEKRGKEEYS